MFARDNVVWLVLFDAVVLVEQAILTTEVGPLRDPISLGSGNSHGMIGS
jgi:hypothetical protein